VSRSDPEGEFDAARWRIELSLASRTERDTKRAQELFASQGVSITLRVVLRE